MDKKLLGKQLREARLSKKMTQSEVAGTFITRNMLSLIESGSAMPSIKTLEYLANVLDLSLATLIDYSIDSMQDKLLSAKEAFREGDYFKVIETVGKPHNEEPFYDEMCALLAITYRKLGENEKSEKYAKLGIYAE